MKFNQFMAAIGVAATIGFQSWSALQIIELKTQVAALTVKINRTKPIW